MKAKQAEKETAGNRVRLSVHVSREIAEELNAVLDEMPFRVTMSGFVETAIRDAIARVKAEGIKLQTPRK